MIRTRDLQIRSLALYPAELRGQISKPSAINGGLTIFKTGDYLVFQAVSNPVPSAYEGLTTVFGMGTGGTPQPSSPDHEVNSLQSRYAPSKLYKKGRGKDQVKASTD